MLGIARDVVRVVQQARREADFQVSDRVRVVLSAPDEIQDVVAAYRDFIAGETLAREVTAGAVDGGSTGSVGEGTEIGVSVRA